MLEIDLYLIAFGEKVHFMRCENYAFERAFTRKLDSE